MDQSDTQAAGCPTMEVHHNQHPMSLWPGNVVGNRWQPNNKQDVSPHVISTITFQHLWLDALCSDDQRNLAMKIPTAPIHQAMIFTFAFTGAAALSVNRAGADWVLVVVETVVWCE